MAGLNLRAIKVAATDQVRDAINPTRPTTVRPFRLKVPGACITVEVTDITYFTTMGPNGQAEVAMDLTITLDNAEKDSAEIAMDDYLSVGTGNGASIADAINADPTLGGVVESCVVLEVGSPTDTVDGYEATFPLKILTRKAGAA